MADRDRSKYLLSAEALPKVKIPRASEHKSREFRLPAALQGGVPSEADASRRVASPTAGPPAEASKAAGPVRGAAQPPTREAKQASVPLAARAGEASTEPLSDGVPRARGKRQDSTLRFKDRTLGWFRAGEELAEEEESDEYEPVEAGRARVLPWAVAVIVMLAALAIAIWQIS